MLENMQLAVPMQWHQAVVIPAYKEGDAFVGRLLDQTFPTATLFIIVLNAPPGVSELTRQVTLQPLDYFQQHCPLLWQEDDDFARLFSLQRHSFLVINLLQPPPQWPLQSGVGYARKLGTDIALWLFAHNHITSPWVRSTDADADWPEPYFLPLAPAGGISAVIYPFAHCALQEHDATSTTAAAIYDAWLRYYVTGLQWSGSPWAFHTIGSTLAIHLEHYAIQRGFPKREAGEDFYLLNKLAKSGGVQILDTPTLRLSNRISDRTPFGTGHAIGKISQSGEGPEWDFYHPDIFVQLKIWHDSIDKLYAVTHLPSALADTPVGQVLHTMGIDAILQHCQRQCATPQAHVFQLWQWFDAAMTRKCVHLLRDRIFGTLDLSQLLHLINQGSLPFLQPPHPVACAQALSQALAAQDHIPAIKGLFREK